MATYSCKIRTNYFKVNDENAFELFMERVYGEDTVTIISHRDNDGYIKYAFYCEGAICGLKDIDGDDDDCSYDEFLDGLKSLVAEDDAVIIFEVGSESMRYLTGYADIITKNTISFVNLEVQAKQEVRRILDNKGWNSCCSY